MVEKESVTALVRAGQLVITAGGGGIPVIRQGHHLKGVSAVIDKGLASSLLAQQLEADIFVMATDVASVSVHWGTPQARAVRRASPRALASFEFATGSMRPKVEAACEFAARTGNTAAIGALTDIGRILSGQAGTLVSNAVATIEYA